MLSTRRNRAFHPRVTGALMILLVSMVFFQGCSWDNDSAYASQVRAGFMLVEPSAGGLPSVLRIEGNVLTPNWNTEFSLGTLTFSDYAGKEETLWLASGPLKEIRQINLQRSQVEKTYETGENRPDFIAIGEKYIIFSDSVSNQIGFLSPKKREIVMIPAGGKPGRIIYNSEKIYVQLDSSRIALINEKALTQVAVFDIQKPIVEFYFNRQFQVEITAGTPGAYFLSTIEANGNFLSRTNTSVTWQKRRLSPYFSQRFETEYLDNFELKNDGRLQSAGITQQTADNLEVDFFSSILYFSRNDSLFRYDLAADSLMDMQPFPWNMKRSWFWLGAN